MRYLVNKGGGTRRRSSKPPTAKQRAARRRFAAMARARAKAATTRKRAKGGSMAKKRRKAVKGRRGGRRRPVVALRRKQVYVTNPRRRRGGRRRYRRNPAILGQVMQLAGDSVAVLGGQAVGRFVAGLIPVAGGPAVDIAKGALVAIGIKMFGGRVVGGDMARIAAAAAFAAPLRDGILAVAPGAAPFLGAPMMLSGMGSYAELPSEGEVVDEGLGAYSTEPYAM